MAYRGILFALACLALSACDDGGNVDQGTTSTTGGGPHVILDGGGDPAVPPDGAAACPAGACNYQTGEGCAPAAQGCRPELAGGAAQPACEPAGSGTDDAPCADSSTCAAGYLCVSGVCRRLCCGGDWTACGDPDRHCIQSIAFGAQGGGSIPTGAMLCAKVNDCDALDPSSCSAPGTACQIVDATGATACVAEGTGAEGDPCPCQGGFVCVTPSGATPVCRKLCRAVEGGGEPCSPLQTCVHYVKDPPGVGECVQ